MKMKKYIFQPPPKENIPNISTEDIYIDDNFNSFTKPEILVNQTLMEII